MTCLRLSARLTILALAATLAVTLVEVRSVAAQTSTTDLVSRARRIETDINAMRAAERFDAQAQQTAVQRLGQLVLGYIDLSDRAIRAGTEGRRKNELLAAYRAISQPLDRIYKDSNGKLEDMARRVMDVDGDLEALYETAAWKEAQLIASQALYYRNWLHYYGARLHKGAKRKELFEQAERGFSEFAIGDRRTELITESLLGRALCHLELGNYEWAVRDFKIVSEDRDISPGRRAKARLGLLDASVRTGNVEETIRISEQLLDSRTADQSLIRYYRLRALLSAAKSSSGSQAEGYRKEALAEMDRLRQAGRVWREKAEALVQAEVKDPERWAPKARSPAAKWSVAKLLVQKGDYRAARPLLEAIVAGNDADSRRVAAEAHYLLGLACFQAGEYLTAAGHFSDALLEPDPAYAADAAYMRFKSLEAVVAQNSETDPQGYETAMRDYLAQYPDHRSVFEARYRLGEWLQADGQFSEAVEQYEQVSGDKGFELRGRFAALQCRFEILKNSDGRRMNAAERRQLIANIGEDLERFSQLAKTGYEKGSDEDAVPLADLRAKAAVMNAVYATVSAEPHHEEALAGLANFEENYPDHSDLFPQVVRLRLGALQRVGRFAEAAAEVREHGTVLRTDGDQEAIESLATAFRKEGVRRKAKGDQSAGLAADKVASLLFELLLAESDGSAKTKLTLAKLYEGSEEFTKATALYEEILDSESSSLVALRGLARVAEAQENLRSALGYWRRILKNTRPGDHAWYSASYHTARLFLAVSEREKCCELLNELKPAMPGLGDADLRARFSELYEQACG